MSVQPKFENVFPVTENRFPIVFRFEGLHPKDIWRILMHDRRRGGDLSHVDPAATPFNERLLGEPDWDKKLKSEIRAAREGNFAGKIRALEAKSRKKKPQQSEGLAHPIPGMPAARDRFGKGLSRSTRIGSAAPGLRNGTRARSRNSKPGPWIFCRRIFRMGSCAMPRVTPMKRRFTFISLWQSGAKRSRNTAGGNSCCRHRPIL